MKNARVVRRGRTAISYSIRFAEWFTSRTPNQQLSTPMVTTLANWLLITIYFVAATLTLPLLYQIIPKHESPGGKPLILMLIGIGIWAFTATMQLAIPIEATKIYFLKLSGIGISIAPIAWFVFVVEYTQIDLPEKLKIYTIFGALAGLQNLFISTNELHNLYWTTITTTTVGELSLLTLSYGPLFYAYMIFLVGVTLAGLAFLFIYAINRGTTYQAHARLLGLSVSFILTAAIVTFSSLGPYNGHLNMVPIGILVANFALITAMYRFDLLELSPTERDHLLYEQEGIHEAERLIEADSMDLPRTDIGEVAKTSREEFYEKSSYNPDNVSISVDCDLTTPANTSLIQQLFYALYENSIQHNTPPVEVHVSDLAFENGFAVEDNGTGIPDTYKNSVFETGISFDSSGTGNGLAVIDRITEGHQWTVNLTDSADGGARFEFTNMDQTEK